MNFGCNEALSQATNPAPRGGIPGPCPPNKNCAPPQARTVPRRNLKARGYWSANRGPDWCFFGLTSDFKTFLGWRPFFFGDHQSSAGKSPAKSVKTFFFSEITCFRPEKPLEFPISAGKSLWIFGLHLVYFIQTGINFSCPSRIHINKLLVSPKIYFCPPPPPPSHAIQAPGLPSYHLN